MSTYAYDTYIGDGTTKQYALTFPFISRSHVKVKVGDTVLTVNGDYTWVSDSLIELSSATQETIAIYRETPKDAPVMDFQDGAVLTEDDLDTLAAQMLYAVQEALDSSLIDVENLQDYVDELALGNTTGEVQKWAFEGDGAETTFTLASPSPSHTNEDYFIVAVNGLLQRPDTDFTVNTSNELVFTVAPADSSVIAVQNFGISRELLAPADESVTSAKLSPDCGVQADNSTEERPFTERFADRLNVKDFGAVGNGVTDDSAAIQAAIDEMRDQEGEIFFPPGVYRINSQLDLSVDGSSGSCRVDLVGSRFTTIKSYVTGSVAGYDTDGFAIVADGWRESTIRGLTIDFANGTAGMAVRCRKQSSVHNVFDQVAFIGGTAKSDREDTDRIGLRFIGNESGAASTGYACFWNQLLCARFNIAHRCIELIDGDGDPSTKYPNAQRMLDCMFERYIWGIYAEQSDEHVISGWWNQADGVTGINGNYTTCFRTDGTLNVLAGLAEPGANSKPFDLQSNATSNTITIVQNTTVAGDIDTAVEGDNFILTTGRMDGLKRLNHLAHDVDGEQDLNVFGDGANSQAGAGLSRVNVWGRSTGTKYLSLGLTATEAEVAAVGAQDLRLAAASGQASILGDGTWDGNIARIGSIRIWADGATPRYKIGSDPASASDGTAF